MDVRALAIGMVIGSVVAVCEPVATLPAVVAAGLLAIAAWWWRSRATVLGLLVGLLATWLLGHWQISQRLADRWPVTDAAVTVTGTVVGLPDNTRRGAPDPQPDRTRLRLRTADGDLLWLSWYRPDAAVRAGDCWQFTVRLRDLRGLANQGGFDYEAWLLREGFAARGSVRSATRCDAAATGLVGGLGDRIDRWRDQLGRAITQGLGQAPGTALLRALTLGDRRGFTDADWAVLRVTGTSHLVAISGLHIGLLAVLGFALGGWCWRRSAWLCARVPAPWAAGAFSIAVAAAYAAAAGFALPTQRALVMVIVFAVTLAAPVRLPGSAALAIAAVAVLLLDPLATLSPGFWLSFGAVGLILWMLAGRTSGHGPFRLLALQIGLSLGLAPLALYFFGQTSVVGVLVNLVLVPAFALITPVVLVVTAGAALAPAWMGPLAALVADGLSMGWQVLSAVADWPGAAWAAAASPWAAALAMLGALWLLAPLPLPWRLQGLVLWLPLLAARPVMPTVGAWVDVLDVGQGLSVVVRTAGHVLVYDTGPAYPSGFNTAEAVVLPMLRSQHLRAIDTLVISHGDSDHAGGAAHLVAAMMPAQRWGHGGMACAAGGTWTVDGVRFAFLHPPAGATLSGNNASCVLRIAVPGGGSLLIPGDIEASAERDLVARDPDALAVDALIVPHHGSDGSSTPAFLDAVSPRLAIAPAGWDNRWGFPRPAVLDRLDARGVSVVTTGAVGQVRVVLPADEPARIAWVYRAHAPRRWRARPPTD